MENQDITTEIYDKTSPFWVLKTSAPSEKFENFYNTFLNFPENIKELLCSAETAEIIWDISKSNNLEDDQITKLSLEILKLAIAEIPTKQFIPNLVQFLRVKQEIAENIAQEANEKIFSKAVQQIKKLHEQKFTPAPKYSFQDQREKIFGKVQEQRANQQESIAAKTLSPQERTVNLQQNPAPASKIIRGIQLGTGPKIEGNTVDLS